MSLSRYKEKRSFDKTPEPTGGKPFGTALRFVIQKHAASHLHYDFRMEMQGVLKSWAVPKGPSMNAADKRLAMMVEDHPWDYRDFEGIIPEGYGAGTVIVWDEGTYEPVDAKASKKENDKLLLHHLYKGQLNFVLHGKKLKGEFSLVKTPARGDNAWLLMKKKDKHASIQDITKKDKSVLSGKNLEQVRMTSNNKWKPNRAQKDEIKKDNTKTQDANGIDLAALIMKGKKQSMPGNVKPMLCTLVKEAIDDPNYLYEIKWDGYRLISYVENGKVRLDSRSGLDYTKKYPPLAKALKEMKIAIVMDGEAIVPDEKGAPDFDALQKFNGHDDPICYYAFDLLWIGGYNVMCLTLTERKQILKEILQGNDIIRYSDDFDDGPALFKEMEKLEMEGMVAKLRNSIYHPGERGRSWLKIPTEKRQEFVIGGWAESDKERSFKSLLFGAYNKKRELEWIGRSGGGYKEKEMPGILNQLKQLEIESSPFVNKILDTKGAVIHYVKPQLVANFSFAAWTESGRIRKPATFLGFRKDKKAKQVVREIAKDAEEVGAEPADPEVNEVKRKKEKTPAIQNSEGSNWNKINKIKIISQDEIDIGDCKVELINIEREIWKGITKAELIQYYHSVASYILPYIKDRPQSLHVKPLNAYKEGFYIKDMENHQPDCAQIFTDERKHKKAGKRDQIDYLVCNNEATLLYMINLGCVDVNPWTARTANPKQPDYIVIDLDPTDNDFTKVIETARASKEYFDKMKLKSFVKTSGKSGMHLLLPCSGFSFPEARRIAEYICGEIQQLVPQISTTEISVSQRGSKLYIDPNQNDYADTIAAPYSARPFHVPTVSTPLEWKEVNSKLTPGDYTIKTIVKRIEKKGDLFKGLADLKIIKWNKGILKRMA